MICASKSSILSLIKSWVFIYLYLDVSMSLIITEERTKPNGSYTYWLMKSLLIMCHKLCHILDMDLIKPLTF